MKTKVTFTLPAANIIGASKCVLLGEFNNWNLEEGIYLVKQPDGSMSAEVELTAGRDYQYRYLLSNGRWVNDDAEKITSDTPGYPVLNCIVRVPAISEFGTEAVKVTKPKIVRKKTAAIPKTDADKDDLTKIEGVGKAIQALLYKNNIYSYKQLSKKTIISLKEILESGGSKFNIHHPGTWPKQSKLAAAGKWEELKLSQKHLKGGK